MKSLLRILILSCLLIPGVGTLSAQFVYIPSLYIEEEYDYCNRDVQVEFLFYQSAGDDDFLRSLVAQYDPVSGSNQNLIQFYRNSDLPNGATGFTRLNLLDDNYPGLGINGNQVFWFKISQPPGFTISIIPSQQLSPTDTIWQEDSGSFHLYKLRFRISRNPVEPGGSLVLDYSGFWEANGGGGDVTISLQDQSTLLTRPIAPVSLQATQNECNQVTLNWTLPQVDACSNARVQVVVDNALTPPMPIYIAKNATTYTHTGIPTGASHTYQVRVIHLNNPLENYSELSNSTVGKARDAAPDLSGFNLVSVDCDGDAIVQWTNGGLYSQINTILDPGLPGQMLFTMSGTRTSDTINIPTDGSAHAFKVYAIDACNDTTNMLSLNNVSTPQPPGSFTLSNPDTAAGVIILNWSASQYATQYTVSRNPAFGSPVVVNGLTYTDETAATCTQYSYRITAMNDCGNRNSGPFKPAPTITPGTPALSTNGLIGSKGYYPDRVELDWVRPDDLSFDHYKIYRRRLNSTADSIQIGIVDKNALHYVDDYAEAGVLYRYYVLSTSECNGSLTASNAMVDIGFRLPVGSVSGNIHFESGQPVEGVQVTVDRVEGNVGRAMRFSGAGSLEFNPDYGDSDDLALRSQMTVEFWMRELGAGTYDLFRRQSSVAYGLRYLQGQGFLQYHNDGGNVARLYAFTGLDTLPYVHIAWIRDGANLALYLNGEALADVSAYPYPTGSGANDFSIGESFTGLIDEFRIWKDRAKTPDSLILEMHRFLKGDEPHLIAYWGINEGIGSGVYDVSGQNEAFNGNHLLMTGDASWESLDLPTTGQIGNLANTDANGNYIVRNIRYTDQGNTFSVNPFFAPGGTPHDFGPSSRVIFIGEGAVVQTGIDFTDNSSFRVRLRIKYDSPENACENTTARILVDDQLVLKDGQVLMYDPDQELYEFEVPIGLHRIKVEESGHIFADGGTFPPIDQPRWDFQADVDGIITLIDLTKIRVAGRVVGGTREGDKVLTFDKSINNIGIADVIYASENGCDVPGAMRTDSASGEYVIDLLPFRYQVEVNMVNNADLFNDLDAMDFRTIPALTWVYDTLRNPGGQAIGLDSNFYHHAQNFIYRALPALDVVDAKTGDPLSGEPEFIYDNMDTGTADTIDLSGLAYPVFFAAHKYSARISAFEEYLNFDLGMPAAVDRVPITDGTLRIVNGLGNSIGLGVDYFEEHITLEDADGDTVYTFFGGVPEIAAQGAMSFTKTMEVTLSTPESETQWLPGGQPFLGYVFGGLPIPGSSFVTQGPETVDYVLRDPPGSGSSSYFKEETTASRSKDWFSTTGASLNFAIGVQLGAEFGVSGEVFSFNTKIVGGIANETEITGSFDIRGNYIETTSFSTTIATSDQSNLTGGIQDVFIGNAYNFLFGAANELSMINADLCALSGSDCLAGTDIIVNNTTYRLGKRKSLFMAPDGFATSFAFTQFHIENDLIPNLKSLRNQLILQDGNAYTLGASQIPADSPAFGLNNDDPTLEDYGYPVVNSDPATTESEDYSGASYVYTPAPGDIPDDRVRWYNQQIRLWTEALAANEREKLEAAQKRNISYTGGTTYSYDFSSSSTEETSQGYELSLSNATTIFFEAIVAGSGLTSGLTIGVNSVGGQNTAESTQEVDAYGYTLFDGDTGDFLSIDVKDGGRGNGPIFSLRGGESMCPWERGEETKYYEPGTALSESTIRREWPDLDVTPAIAVNVPEHQPAVFNLKLRNLSPTGDVQWYGLRVLEQTNPDATLTIDGLSPNRVFEVEAGQTVEKVLKLYKGALDDYDGIQLVLYSTCEYDAYQNGGNLISADTISISAHFVQTCSPVSVVAPDDQWILNTDDGALYPIQISGLDQSYDGFQRVQLQYKTAFSSDWKGIETYWKGQVPQGQDGEVLQAGASTQSHLWDVSEIADGPYDLRAVSFCLLNKYESPAVTGMIDRVRPHAFGNPQPADGVLDPDDDILVQFNETIDPTAISRDNFSIRGVLNGTTLRHNTAIQLDGINDYVQPQAGTRIGAHPFTIEMWVYRTSNGAATLWSQGEAVDSSVVLGFTSSNALYLRYHNTMITSAATVTSDALWHHIVVTCNSLGVVSFYETGNYVSSGVVDSLLSFPGPMVIGKNAWNAFGGFAGYMHEFRIWKTEQTLGQIQGQMLKTLSGNELGLSILWPMDEGAGTSLRDIVRKKQATLYGDWAILPSGKALTFDGTGDRLDVTPSSLVFTRQHSFTIEFWLKTAPGSDTQTILSNGRGDGTDGLASGWSFSVNPDGKFEITHGSQTFTAINKNVRDDNWHHVAMSMNRNGNLNVYLDGVLQSSLFGTSFGEFAGPRLYVGARGWPTPGSFDTDQYYAGDLDDIRIWVCARTKAQIQLDMQYRLMGDEPGLLLYLPFESYTELNGIATLTPSLEDQGPDMLMVAPVGSPTYQSADPNLKIPRPVVDINFDWAINNDRIVLTLLEDPVRIENVVLDISAFGLRDLRGNYMAGPITWTAYVNRNQLHWTDSELAFEKPEKEALNFDAQIENSGGIELSYEILNLPEWLSASPSEGSIGPVSTKTIHFTINPDVNIGDYSADINLLSGQGFNDKLILDLHVFGVPPQWDFDPTKYAHNMNIVADLEVEGDLSDDPLDRVVAYVNGEVRGLAELQYVEEYDRYEFFLDVYSNVASGEDITFKVWDASTGLTYAGVLFSQNATETLSIPFVANTLRGTPAQPARFIVNQDLIQNIPLNAGWTWISFNVQSAKFNDLDDFFAELQLENNDQVLSRTRQATYVPSSGFGGSLSNQGLSILEMYKCNFVHADILQVVGPRVNPQNNPITITQGIWNWIPFLGSERIEINEALADFDEVTPGDQIKSQSQFAVYDGIQQKWIGTLKSMEPGKGYMLFASHNGSLIYPLTAQTPMQPATFAEHERFDISWRSTMTPEVADARKFNMTLITVLADGEHAGPVRIAAFMRGELLDLSKDISGMHYLTLQANGEVNDIYFEIYDNHGAFIGIAEETLQWGRDEMIGTLDRPFVLHLKDAHTGSMIVSPNPFSDAFTMIVDTEITGSAKATLFDLHGRTIDQQQFLVSRAGRHYLNWNGLEPGATSLLSGTYLLQLIIGDEIHQQLIVKQ